MWTSPAIPVPIETPEDADGTEEDPIPWNGASLTESWFDSFYGYAAGKWKLLVPDGGEPFFPEAPALPQRPGPGHVVPFRKQLMKRPPTEAASVPGSASLLTHQRVVSVELASES
jgi:hypothetical protein